MPRRAKMPFANDAVGGRTRILDAVATLLVERGPGALSVDNILAVSGLSKGGFFYHFKTKQEALLAAFEAQVEKIEAMVTANVATSGPAMGKKLHAYIRTVLDPKPGIQKRLLESTVRTLVALLNDEPALMPEVAKVFRRSGSDLGDDGIPWEVRVLICETVEGLWLSRALGIGHYTVDEERRIAAYLLDLASRPSVATPDKRIAIESPTRPTQKHRRRS